MARYAGDYECPQCGHGSNDLKPESRAMVLRRLGEVVKLACAICTHRFLLNETTGRKPAGNTEA